MTHRLYYTDAYLTEFDAAIVERADGGRRVYLDRTAFYPASGGQPCDSGWLGEAPVTEVVDEEDRIAHLLSAPIAGERISGRIAWPRRFDHMQQHTGQHLLSAVLQDLFGYRTISVHFGPETSTLDLEVESIAPERVRLAESRANAVVFENRPVGVHFEEAATAIGLRKVSAREGPLRIVTIQDLDRSACGGTHVRATGEVGPILLRKIDRVQQLVRLEFVCGGRAVRQAREDYDLLARLAASASSSPRELPALWEAQRAELKASEAARRELQARLSASRAQELYASAAAGRSGLRRHVERMVSGSIEEIRPVAQAFAALPQALFIASSLDPPAILLASSADSGVDAGLILKPILSRAGGRGGGSSRLAQGSLPTRDAVEQALNELPSP